MFYIGWLQKFGHVGPSCPRRTSKYIVYICVHVIELEPRFTDQRFILSTYTHVVDHSCQLLAWSPWSRLPPRITALCSYWRNAICAEMVWGGAWFPGTHQDGTLGGLDAVSWCLELDDTSRRSEGCGCNGPSFPSNNPIITGQRSFLGCHSSLFPFMLFLAHFSSHLLLRFWRNQWGVGGQSQKRARLGASVCLRGSCSADPPSGVIWLGLLSEEKSDTSLGMCTLHRCPADGKGPGSTSAGWRRPSFDGSSGARVLQFRERRRLVFSPRPGWILSTK